jgi:imidazole glycerol-phosphate synthase subunit HisH
MIGIVDVDIGNLKSLSNAVYSLGYDYTLVGGAASYDDLTHLIIPGVGAYRRAMQQIEEHEARGPILAFAASGRPVLGICLGMQILSSVGEEGGDTAGLGIVPGRVVRLAPEGDLALPHIGWNTTTFECDHPVFRKVKTGRDFYYVHSYRFVCDDPAHALGSSEYGGLFTSIVGRANVLGFQFHPEKSQANGLKLIENFCDWNGVC